MDGRRGVHVFVALVAFLVVQEWRGLVVRFPDDNLAKAVWMTVGGVYVALGCASVLLLHDAGLFLPVLAVSDRHRYRRYCAAGFIGGPRIAPAISPVQDLGRPVRRHCRRGGCLGFAALSWLAGRAGGLSIQLWGIALAGAGLAIVAQAGDFFESWMSAARASRTAGH